MFPWAEIISGASSLLGGALSNKAAKDSQERSIAAQRSLQNVLLNSGGQLARSAKQAGLNPAFSLGSSSVGSASTPASPSANYDFSGLSQVLSNHQLRKLQAQQEKLSKANTAIASEKAKQEAIITDNMRSKQDWFTKQHVRITTPDGKVLMDDDAHQYLNSHPNFDPNKVEIIKGLTEGQREAQQIMSENETKDVEREGRKHEVSTQDVERLSRESVARFEKALNDAKLSDSDYIRVALQLPKEQLNDIISTIKLKGLQAAYQKIINKQTEDSSMGHLLDKLGNPDMNFFDKVLAVVAWLGNNIGLSMRLGK